MPLIFRPQRCSVPPCGAGNRARSRLSAGWTRWKAGPRPERPPPNRTCRSVQQLSGQGEVEGGAGARGGLHPQASAEVFDDSLADGKAQAGAGVPAGVEALERIEDARLVLGGNSDAVVP